MKMAGSAVGQTVRPRFFRYSVTSVSVRPASSWFVVPNSVSFHRRSTGSPRPGSTDGPYASAWKASSSGARPARRTATSGTRAIAAPMPGRVVRVLVSAGDSVDTGTPLLGIEAMKMENQLSASAPGVVARVLVDVGDTVEANQQLMVIDPAPEPRE
jgi:biotin carboxyl carrier protein